MPALTVSFEQPERLSIHVGSHVLHTDEPGELGGHGEGPRVGELVAAAAAARAATEARAWLRREALPELGLRLACNYRLNVVEETRLAALDVSIQLPRPLGLEAEARLAATVERCLEEGPAEISVTVCTPTAVPE